jgi:hypothetical protein
VLAGGALEPGEVSGHCQPQPVSERPRRIGGYGAQLGKGRHAMTLQRRATAVKQISTDLACRGDAAALLSCLFRGVIAHVDVPGEVSPDSGCRTGVYPFKVGEQGRAQPFDLAAGFQ